MSETNDKLEHEWDTLIDEASELMNRDILLKEDLMVLKKISYRMSLLVLEVDRIASNQKAQYKTEYSESYEYLRWIWKTCADATEFSKAQANRKFPGWESLESYRDSMKLVIRQIEWFTMQWNFNKKIEAWYIDSELSV